MKGHDGLEVDNCDIFNWPEAAIAIGRTGSGNQSDNNNKIHHNSKNTTFVIEVAW